MSLASMCGAVAVSHYGRMHEDSCFDTIRRLSDFGLRQVNIHKLLSKQTYRDCFDLIDRVKADPRVAGLKAIVFLLLKPKGDRNNLDSIVSLDDYRALVDRAIERSVAIGMDSCSAPMVLRTMPAEVIPSVEPCESTLFSIYVNVKGEMFPCSFTEGTPGWESGIPLDGPLRMDDAQFLWYHSRVVEWRRNLLESSNGCSDCGVRTHCRSCPVYDITICQPKPALRYNENPVQLGREERIDSSSAIESAPATTSMSTREGGNDR
jgi:radical SAM protein with 4Fe4S-binding SPASM domain